MFHHKSLTLINLIIMQNEKPKFKAIADHALLITFSDVFSEAVHSQVVALDNSITLDPPQGLIETVPAIVNLLVTFDPLITDHSCLEKSILNNIKNMTNKSYKGTERIVHVCYEEGFSRDLETVSKACGLSKEAVINAHLNEKYNVLMYGFSPGYAYLSGVPKDIQVPRKNSAVRDIDAGSVIIAGSQCLVTTLKMPTGWSIIGRSPTLILTDDLENPFLFNVGDTVNFKRIDLGTFEKMNKASNYV